MKKTIVLIVLVAVILSMLVIPIDHGISVSGQGGTDNTKATVCDTGETPLGFYVHLDKEFDDWNANEVNITDFDNDGCEEIFTLSIESGYYSNFCNFSFHVFGYNGIDYVEEWNSGNISYNTSNYWGGYDSVHLENCTDIDNDGYKEIIVRYDSYFNDTIYIIGYNGLNYLIKWEGNPSGDPYYNTDIYDIVDLNNDGYKEIVIESDRYGVYDSTNSTICIIGYDGTSYQQIWVSDDLGNAGIYAIEDLNNDGAKEIIITRDQYLSVVYYHDEEYKRWESDYLNNSIYEICIADVNNDYKKIILTTHDCVHHQDYGYNYTLHIFSFDGISFTHWKSKPFFSKDYMLNMDISDMNNDGFTDIILYSDDWSHNSIYIFDYDGTTYAQKWKEEYGKNETVYISFITDIDNDGYNEIIAEYTYYVYSEDEYGYPYSENDSYSKIYIYGYDGTTYKCEWESDILPYPFLSIWNITDIDNDGGKEIIAIEQNAPYYCYVLIIDYDGVSSSQWLSNSIGSGWYSYYPPFFSCEDVNNDDFKEIMITCDRLNIIGHNGTSYTQWRSEDISGISVKLIEDIDSDGFKEIVCSGTNLFIFGFNGTNYTLEWESEHTAFFIIYFDINNDGVKEIVCGGGSYIYIVGRNGTDYTMWSKDLGYYYIAGDIELADINDDGFKEIIVNVGYDGYGDYYIIFRYDGTTYTQVWKSENHGYFKVSEMNNDNFKELIIYSGSNCYIFELNLAPIPSISVEFIVIQIGEIVTFDASASYDLDGTVTQYYFDFGDDINSGWRNGNGVSHQYTTSGVYYATLKVRDNKNDNSTATATIPIIVGQPSTPDNQLPVVDAGSDVTVNVGDTVQFSGTTTDSDGYVIYYQWDFDGDGTYDWDSQDTGTTTHTYTSSGTYYAKFRAYDNEGGSVTDTRQVEVKKSVTTTSPPKKEEKGFIPGFETAAFLVAMLGVCAILLRKRKALK